MGLMGFTTIHDFYSGSYLIRTVRHSPKVTGGILFKLREVIYTRMRRTTLQVRPSLGLLQEVRNGLPLPKRLARVDELVLIVLREVHRSAGSQKSSRIREISEQNRRANRHETLTECKNIDQPQDFWGRASRRGPP